MNLIDTPTKRKSIREKVYKYIAKMNEISNGQEEGKEEGNDSENGAKEFENGALSIGSLKVRIELNLGSHMTAYV